jgi:hypothetical protein
MYCFSCCLGASWVAWGDSGGLPASSPKTTSPPPTSSCRIFTYFFDPRFSITISRDPISLTCELRCMRHPPPGRVSHGRTTMPSGIHNLGREPTSPSLHRDSSGPSSLIALYLSGRGWAGLRWGRCQSTCWCPSRDAFAGNAQCIVPKRRTDGTYRCLIDIYGR